MYKYLSLLFCGLFCGVLNAAALTVETPAAGTLAACVSTPETVTTLTVTGPVNAADLFFIDSKMSSLRELDLSGVTIEAYEGSVQRGLTRYSANTIPTGTFAAKELRSVVLPSTEGLVLGESSFAGTALESLTIPSTVGSVGAGAFSACTKLTEVTLGSSNLGSHVFSQCTALTKVTFTQAMELPASTFAGCTELTNVNGSELLQRIGKYAFADCSSLNDFSFGRGLRTIADHAFRASGLHDVQLNQCNSLDSVGPWAFAVSPELTSVTMPEKVAYIGEGVFFDCERLETFDHHQNNTSIPAYAFKGDEALDTTGLFHKGLERIGDYALMGLTQIEEVNLPSSLTYIGTGAMENNTGLRNINAKALSSVPELGENVWAGVDQEKVTLYVDTEMYDTFSDAAQWQNFDITTTTGVDAIEVEGNREIAVEGRFSGSILELRSLNGAPIEKVDIYTPSGALVLSTRPGVDNASISTSDYSGTIFIVDCTLADGKVRATLKLVRR